MIEGKISYDPNKKNVSKTKESKIKPPKIECINDIKEEEIKVRYKIPDTQTLYEYKIEMRNNL